MTLGPAIILIIVAAIAGYVIGIVDSRLTAAVSKKIEAENLPAPKPEAPEAEPSQFGEHVVLKATIDKALKWHVELDGARLESPNAVSPQQHQRMLNVIMQLRPWIDGKPAAPAQISPEATAPTLSSEPASRYPSAPAALAPLASAPQPKIDAMRGFRSLLKNDIKSPDQMKSISIVAMIDDVLQARLLNMPQITKSVRLEEGATGEVVVYVGTRRFDSVEAVPDTEIQALIKSAIADWEKR